MDIIKLGKDSFKIKSKTGSVEIDPKGFTIESLTGYSKSFQGAGEYEVAGISVLGISTEEGIVFIYEADNLRICHLGNLKKKLPESKVSLLGDIDILLVPVGQESIEMIQQVESYYVIPFNYESEEILDKFLKESGLVVERNNKFSLKKEEIIEESPAQIIVLEDR